MSNVVNRLKMVDSVVGESRYDRQRYNIDKYFNIIQANEVIEKILINEKGPLTLKELRFLNMQDVGMLDKIKERLNSNEESVRRYLSKVDYSNYPKIDSEVDVEIFDMIINTRYYCYANVYLSILKDDEDRRNIVKLLNLAIDKDYSPEQYGYGAGECYVSHYSIAEILENRNIMNLPSDEIDHLIKVCNESFENRSFNGLTEEHIAILKDPMARYIREINIEQLNMIKRFSEFLPSAELNSIKYSGNFIFELKNEVLSFIDTIEQEIAEKDIQVCNLNALIDAFARNYIQDDSDVNLLNNKIKYGARYSEGRDIAFDLANISKEAYVDAGMSSEDLALLLKIKKQVSKGFYRTLTSNEKLLYNVYKVDVSTLMEISKVIELGQLNENQMLKIFNLIYNDRSRISQAIKKLNVRFKISFDEFEFIIQNYRWMDANFINSIKVLKQTQRLLKMKEKAEINRIINNERFVINEYEIKDLIEDLDIKTLMKKNNPLRIKDIKNFIEYYVINSRVKVNSIDELNKVKFVCRYSSLDSIKDKTMEELDEVIWSSEDVNNLLKRLDLSEDFKNEYKDNIIKFCLSDDFHLTTSYLKNYKVRDTQQRGILLITKAIMANKYEELKFVKSDIKKEISMEISDEAFNAWKRTDVLERDTYTVKDSSDFSTIMRMGEIPVRSCMNYVDGMYSHCLLSNFDTSKKMMTIYKNGRYVGRAILRLTVMSDVNTEETHLDFIDFDNQDGKETSENDKKLIIFLEKAYTTLDSNDFKEVYPMMIELLKQKGEEMGATVVASRNYNGYVGDDCTCENKYVFITASKNGAQYLDSFDGSTSNAYCYKNGNVYIY